MVQLQADVTSGNLACQLPYTSAPNMQQNHNQVLPDTRHADPLKK